MTNPNNCTPSAPSPQPPPVFPHLNANPDLDAPPKQPWEALRRFLACNPFYLLSAALLLYSFYLVAADRNFLPTEIAQLFFNLGSLQLYELVVVATAIWLARRAVWYDSTLLVGLENLLVLVPFILVSEGALIDLRLVWVLCIAAGLLAALRLNVLKRFIRELNFPPRLLGIGLLMLVANATVPAVYRVLHQSKVGKGPDWGAAYETNQYVWWLLVPASCALSSVVPCSRGRTSDLWPQRRWLPMGLFSLWLVGTGVHLYCLTYVYDFALRPELLAPALWTLSWMLCLRVSGWLPDLKPAWRNALWSLPMLATLLAVSQPQKTVFLVLTGLNVAIYGFMYKRHRVPTALHLVWISAVALLGGLPEDWGHALTAQFSREKLLAAAAAVYALVCISMVRNAKVGLLGAGIAAVTVAAWGQHRPDVLHWAVQVGLAFLLLHSLRWIDSKEPGADLLRWLAASAWAAHSLMWVHLHDAGWRACAIALPVLAVLLALRWLRGKWGPMAVLVSALLVLLAAPGHSAALHLKSTPTGLLAVVASFVLFGLGTLGAITKHRWGASSQVSLRIPPRTP